MRFKRIWTLLGAGAMTAAFMGPKPAAAEPVDCAAVKCVALTFDDGPSRYTAKLLTMLERSHARATFFVVGDNSSRYPKLLDRMVSDGFELGTHTQSHPNLTRLSPDRIRAQIKGPIDDIERTGQPGVTLLRPPYGATDAKVTKVAKELGLAQILWSVDPQDWLVRNSVRVSRRILANAHRGSIVLVHDIHPTTVAAMPAVIKELQKRGYHLVTVSELLGSDLEAGRKYFRQ